MNILIGILFIVVCVLLILVVLLQKGRGGGLAGAFGGAGAHSAFGTRTGDMFTWITVVLVALFLLLGVAAVHAFRPQRDVVTAPQIGQRGETPPPAPVAPEADMDAADVDVPDVDVPETDAAPATTAPAIAPVTTAPAIAPVTTAPATTAPTTAPADQ